MKKIVAALCFVALAALVAPAHAGVVVRTTTGISTNWNGSFGLNLYVNQVDENEIGGGHTTTTVANVNAFGFDFEDAYGPVIMSADPAMLNATIAGTLLGRLGPVTINLTYRQTHVSNQVPTVDAEAGPNTGSATALENHGAQGRVDGTITTVFGTATLVAAPAWVGVLRTVGAS